MEPVQAAAPDLGFRWIGIPKLSLNITAPNKAAKRGVLYDKLQRSDLPPTARLFLQQHECTLSLKASAVFYLKRLPRRPDAAAALIC
jgi:hypothetical protein